MASSPPITFLIVPAHLNWPIFPHQSHRGGSRNFERGREGGHKSPNDPEILKREGHKSNKFLITNQNFLKRSKKGDTDPLALSIPHRFAPVASEV